VGLARQIINNILRPVEYSINLLTRNRKWYPPIFVIGAPRSSSTLFYQAVTDSFDVCYISNFIRNLYIVPATGWLLQSLILPGNYSSDYSSEHGRTKGYIGPNEAAEFWYQWFPKGLNVYVDKNKINEKIKKSIRNKILLLSKVSGKPVVFKNLYNSMRINPLVESIPESIFVVCKRNPVYIVQSILLSRLKVLGSIKEWWSVPPRQINEILNMEPVKQVAMQVYLVYKQINEDLERNNAKRVFYVDYNELCDNPGKLLNDFRDWLSQYGIPLKQKKEFPKKFINSNKVKVDKGTFNRIVEEVQLLWKS